MIDRAFGCVRVVMMRIVMVWVVMLLAWLIGCSDHNVGSDDGGRDAQGDVGLEDSGRNDSSDDSATDACSNAPGIETCDEVDNDCDGEVDEDLATTAWYIDRDQDRRGDLNAEAVLACGTVEGHSIYNDDCDDTDRAIRPTVTELCNGFDDDCDGMTDENVSVLHYRDQDRDGRGAGEPIAVCAGTAAFVQFNDDCDDDNPNVSPTRLEGCDARDNDCDSLVDEGLTCSGGSGCALALAAICDPNANCEEVGNAAVCSCPNGFLDLSSGSDTGITCADIDECRAGQDNCNENATCSNTLGAYTCMCNEGYAGNGLSCIAI